MVKSEGVQRESDGVVVPVIGVEQNAPGGKGPDFGHAGRVGKRVGMTGVRSEERRVGKECGSGGWPAQARKIIQAEMCVAAVRYVTMCIVDIEMMYDMRGEEGER